MTKTLRMIMPQWQGGNNEHYYFGAELLAWLAPKNPQQKTVQVPVTPPTQQSLDKENGVVGEEVLIKQLQAAQEIIQKEQPEKIILLGGDCLAEQAPFDYLHQKYGDSLGIIWIDAHPDISTPAEFAHAHAMVLGNLLGKGDPNMSVAQPLSPQAIKYIGLQEPTMDEKRLLNDLGISYSVDSPVINPQALTSWIEENHFTHLAVHLDLDVLAPRQFRSLLFAKPGGPPINAAEGVLSFEELSAVLATLSTASEIVGLGITEHLPWDDIHLKDFLTKLPIFTI